MRTIITAALVGGLATAALAADCSHLDAKVAAAKTAADHEALAKCYDERAKAARESGEEHKKLAAAYQAYTRAPMGKSQLWAEAFAKTLEAEAKTYDSMAAAHRDVAKTLE